MHIVAYGLEVTRPAAVHDQRHAGRLADRVAGGGRLVRGHAKESKGQAHGFNLAIPKIKKTIVVIVKNPIYCRKTLLFSCDNVMAAGF
jgi:hypothetical protein